MKQIAIFLIFVFVSFSIAACGDGTQPANTAANRPSNTNIVTATPLPSATIDELASGKKVYEINCANCHKADGTGGPIEIEGKKIKPENLTSDKIKGFSDEKIIGYIMNGIEDEGMPAFKDKLSEGELRDVVKYLRTQIQKMPAAKN
jgi:cytochrome c oxidase cbb3-type subunit 3